MRATVWRPVGWAILSLSTATGMARSEIIELVNSVPGLTVGESEFSAWHDTLGIGEEGEDVFDVPWSAVTPPAEPKWLRIQSQPYGVPLRIDNRPIDSLSPFAVDLVAVDTTGEGISTQNRLFVEQQQPLDGGRGDYRIDVSIWGVGDSSAPYFASTYLLSDLMASGRITDTWSITNVPNEHVYGSIVLTPLPAPARPVILSLQRSGADLVLTAAADAGIHRVGYVNGETMWQTDDGSAQSAASPDTHVWTVTAPGGRAGTYRVLSSRH